MSSRVTCTKYMNLVRPLLSQPGQPQLVCNRKKSTIWPMVPFLNKPSMFSFQVMRRFYECIPIITIVTIGVTLEALWTLRLACTRDDVRSLMTKKMAIEKEDYKEKEQPPVRKFLVINDEYKWPEGLIPALNALKEPTDEERAQMEEDRAQKGKKKKKSLFIFAFFKWIIDTILRRPRED